MTFFAQTGGESIIQLDLMRVVTFPWVDDKLPEILDMIVAREKCGWLVFLDEFDVLEWVQEETFAWDNLKHEIHDSFH